MSDHITSIELLVNQLASVGLQREEFGIQSKILSSLPVEYNDFRHAWGSVLALAITTVINALEAHVIEGYTLQVGTDF